MCIPYLTVPIHGFFQGLAGEVCTPCFGEYIRMLTVNDRALRRTTTRDLAELCIAEQVCALKKEVVYTKIIVYNGGLQKNMTQSRVVRTCVLFERVVCMEHVVARVCLLQAHLMHAFKRSVSP